MRNHLNLLSGCLVAVVLWCGPTLGASHDLPAYHTVQITQNNSDDLFAQVNDEGHVVWVGAAWDGSGGVFLYDGSTTRKLADPDSYNYPQISDNNHVVWQGIDTFDWEIFVYDGVNTTQLTNNSLHDSFPLVNENGYVVWTGGSYVNGEIFLNDGSSTIQLTNNSNDDRYPSISSDNHVVWQGSDGSDLEIYLYDGASTVQLTSNQLMDTEPQVASNRRVVWQGYDGSDWEIYFYDGIDTIQLTDNQYTDRSPQIGNNGHIVWSGSDGSDFEIYLYDGSGTIQISDNDVDDINPQINDHGYVVWQQLDYDTLELFLFNGETTVQLTDTGDANQEPQISNNGCVAWFGYDGFDWEIYRSCPHSGLVDLEPSELASIDVPWWKSEEYWGGLDPRILLRSVVHHNPIIPGIEPEPLPCPQCVFSRDRRQSQMPSYLPGIYQAVHDAFELSGQRESFKENSASLISYLKRVELGQRFDKSEMAAAIRIVQGWETTQKGTPADIGAVIRAINAIELDWRVPPLHTRRIDTGQHSTVDFDGVSWLTFNHVSKSGELSLSIDGSLPAVLVDATPIWPVASYRFDYTAKLEKPVDISFYIGGYQTRTGPEALRILEWDGETYKDVTTVVDWPHRIIRGRTTSLKTYVLATPNFPVRKAMRIVKQVNN